MIDLPDVEDLIDALPRNAQCGDFSAIVINWLRFEASSAGSMRLCQPGVTPSVRAGD